MSDSSQPSGAETELTQLLAKVRQAADEAEKEKSRLAEMNSEALEIIKKLAIQHDELAKSAEALRAENEVLVGTAKDATQIRDAIKADATTAQESLKTASNKVAELITEIDTLQNDRNALKTVVDDVTKLRASIEADKSATSSNVESITEIRQKFDDLRAQTQAAHDELIERRGHASEKIAEIDSTYERIKQERSELLEDREQDGSPIRSIANSIRDTNEKSHALLAEVRDGAETARLAQEKLLSNFNSVWDGMRADFNLERVSLIGKSTNEIETLKADLEQEIRKLLPGAGAAGLASAYYDAKLNYGPGKFAYGGSKEEKWHWLKYFGSWLAHTIRNSSTPFAFYALFIGPLLLVAYYFHGLMTFIMQHPQKFDPEFFLFRVLISLPLVTISLFGWSSIRLHRRLYEEYNHKQRVMELYESFKKEIEKLGTPEQAKALITVMLATVGDKPSLAMHKYDQPFEIKPTSFSLGALVDGAIKSTKESSS